MSRTSIQQIRWPSRQCQACIARTRRLMSLLARDMSQLKNHLLHDERLRPLCWRTRAVSSPMKQVHSLCITIVENKWHRTPEPMKLTCVFGESHCLVCIFFGTIGLATNLPFFSAVTSLEYSGVQSEIHGPSKLQLVGVYINYFQKNMLYINYLWVVLCSHLRWCV